MLYPPSDGRALGMWPWVPTDTVVEMIQQKTGLTGNELRTFMQTNGNDVQKMIEERYESPNPNSLCASCPQCGAKKTT